MHGDNVLQLLHPSHFLQHLEFTHSASLSVHLSVYLYLSALSLSPSLPLSLSLSLCLSVSLSHSLTLSLSMCMRVHAHVCPTLMKILHKVPGGAIANMKKLCSDANHSMAETALAWLLHQTGVTSVIVGASNEIQVSEQYCQNVLPTAAAADFTDGPSTLQR